MEQVEKELDAVEFTSGSKKYKYDRTLITVEQAELACEMLEFKRQQQQKGAESFSEVTRSRGAEWRMIIASYLLREIDEKGVRDFDLGLVSRTEAFVKALPITERARLLECIDDFFSSIGMRQAYSETLSSKRNLTLIDLLPLITPQRQEGK